jgi:hypothetical protein
MNRRVLLVVTLATILSALVSESFAPERGNLPRGFRRPVLAAELVRNADEIRQVYGTNPQSGLWNRPTFR